MIDSSRIIRMAKQRRIDSQKGISGTGGLFGQLASDIMRKQVAIEPGDVSVRASEVTSTTTNPTAYDLWYLKHTQNILTIEDSVMDAVPQSYLEGPLKFLADKLGGIKPKCFLRHINDLCKQFVVNDEGDPISAQWKSQREYFIHLMPFEIWLSGLTAQIPSDGPPLRHGFDPNETVGYLAFPVGQIGVMEVMSFLRESSLDGSDLDISDEEKANLAEAGGGLFPPPDGDTGKNKCFGDHFIESGYVVPAVKRRNVELMAAKIPAQYYLEGASLPTLWMRYWIMNDETFPVPGEFLGVLCKPLALPPHIWWFQESTPFVYAGNWFETESLTGGVVTEVVLEADREDDGIGNFYTVRVQGREIKINSSDFFLYNVDDRVGILKVDAFDDTPRDKSFKWSDQIRITEGDEGDTFGSDQYAILPIAFYQSIE